MTMSESSILFDKMCLRQKIKTKDRMLSLSTLSSNALTFAFFEFIKGFCRHHYFSQSTAVKEVLFCFGAEMQVLESENSRH